MANVAGWGRGSWGSGAWNEVTPIEVTGVSATGSVGSVSHQLGITVFPTGVSATGAVNTPTIIGAGVAGVTAVVV